MWLFLLILIGISGTFPYALKPKHDDPVQCQKSCHPVSDDKFNIHLVPHSHDDVGWLKAPEQYYFGSSGERIYENGGVQYIISSVVDALKANPERRFIQVETAFFWEWWNHQSEQIQQDFIELVNNGQLEMVNGAWSMNDEAATHYQSIIDQFTWGFRRLEETIGTCGLPTISWQIDPFGHSREHASIVKGLGFDGLILDRIDFRDKLKRIENKALDFMWTTSANLADSELFTSMFPDKYDSDRNFCWDVNTECTAESIVDDVKSPEYNLEGIVKNYTDLLMKYKEYYPTNNLIYPMGGDFQYQSAQHNFINLDKLIKGFEDDTTFNVIYSTPSCYVKAVKDAYVKNNQLTNKITTKTDDFFPYANLNHTYWTGYFTSRPTAKRFEKVANNILQAAKQLSIFSTYHLDEAIVPLREALGVLQHHDAITGTERQAVADYYNKLLSDSIGMAEKAFADTVMYNILPDKNDGTSEPEIKWCLLSNVSICEGTGIEDNFTIEVYNPLPRTASYHIRIPVNDGHYKIKNQGGEYVDFDLLTPISTFDYLPSENFKPHPKELVFRAKDLPGLRSSWYGVEKLSTSPPSSENDMRDNSNYFGSKSNGFTVDPATGKLVSIKIRGEELSITQDFYYYSGYNNAESTPDEQNSGAYIFRPNEMDPKIVAQKCIKTVSQKGKLVDEFIQTFDANEITQIVRVYKTDDDSDNEYIEFDWLVGNLSAVDEEKKIGKEIVTKFTVGDGFSNGGIFYTDSNGRELIKREINKRNDYEYESSEEPVTSNYYPIPTKIVIKDELKKIRVAVLNDRAQGGTSMKPNEIEIMIHRKSLVDDGKGANEALDEKQYGIGLFARGSHYLTFGSTLSSENSTAREKDLARRISLSPNVMILPGNFPKVSPNPQFTLLLNKSLPDNVNLLTLERWKDDTILLRLEHCFELGEDAILSQKVKLAPISDYFPFINADAKIFETNLGATNPKQMQESTISLEPMQIRTFLVKLD